MTLYAGVDGGATKTSCALINKDRTVLCQTTAGASNFNSVGDAAAASAVWSAIEQALAGAGKTVKDLAAVCLCLSGVDRPVDVTRVQRWLVNKVDASTQLYIFNDSVAALAAGTDGKRHGIAIISGTGTIVVGFNNKKQKFRASGWGPLLGDEGGGVSIGTHALHAVARAHDGVAKPTKLTETILKQLNLNEPSELIGWAYAPEQRGEWDRVAALSRAVVAASDAGDVEATRILKHAARALSTTAIAIAQKLYLSEHAYAKPPSSSTSVAHECVSCNCAQLASLDNNLLRECRYDVVLAGGNLTALKNSLLHRTLVDELRAALPNCTIHTADNVPACVGAALVARHSHLEEVETATK